MKMTPQLLHLAATFPESRSSSVSGGSSTSDVLQVLEGQVSTPHHLCKLLLYFAIFRAELFLACSVRSLFHHLKFSNLSFIGIVRVAVRDNSDIVVVYHALNKAVKCASAASDVNCP